MVKILDFNRSGNNLTCPSLSLLFYNMAVISLPHNVLFNSVDIQQVLKKLLLLIERQVEDYNTGVNFMQKMMS